MYDSNQKTQWNHTCSIVAILAEINRDKKKRRQSFSVKDFHPYYSRSKPKKLDVGIKALKYIFVDRNSKKLQEVIDVAIMKEYESERSGPWPDEVI